MQFQNYTGRQNKRRNERNPRLEFYWTENQKLNSKAGLLTWIAVLRMDSVYSTAKPFLIYVVLDTDEQYEFFREEDNQRSPKVVAHIYYNGSKKCTSWFI